MATVVSIGRNLSYSPMGEYRWRAFKAETGFAVEVFAGPVIFTGEGVGVWHSADADGNLTRETETAATIIGANEPDADERRMLDDHLAELARVYGQEAIAVTYGPTRFVGPS